MSPTSPISAFRWAAVCKTTKGDQVGDAVYMAGRSDIQRHADEVARGHGLVGYTLENSKGKLVTYTFKGTKTQKQVHA